MNTKQTKGRKMEHLYAEADAGSVTIGNDTMRYQVRNGYGDGTVDIYVNATAADMDSLAYIHDVDEWVLEGVTYGTTHIYPYDCLYNYATGELIEETPIATLDGCYACYSGKGLRMRRGAVIFVER